MADERTKLAYQNRWKTLWNNPKLIVIALFASFVNSHPMTMVITNTMADSVVSSMATNRAFSASPSS